jgi:hypothetical protein
MAKLVAKSAYADPAIYSVPAGYSMAAAVQILKYLEAESDCEIQDGSWKRPGYGNLIEIGIPVRFGTIEFQITSSGGDILIYRLVGNKAKFYEFCRSVEEMEFKSAT